MWIAGLVVFIAAGFTASLALVCLGGLVIVAAVVWSCLGDQLRVRGTLSREQVWVTLHGAHKSFAHEIERALQAVHTGSVSTPSPAD